MLNGIHFFTGDKCKVAERDKMKSQSCSHYAQSVHSRFADCRRSCCVVAQASRLSSFLKGEKKEKPQLDRRDACPTTGGVVRV
jgi:hypothetical protein